MNEFEKLGINCNLIKALKNAKFEKPTEIQEKSIPLVLSGKDTIAQASTGSGKTLAFGSAILQNTKKDFGIQSLVLTPTRELAEQIARALIKFSEYDPLRITAVYGGVSITPQIKDLEYADVVIGTPGRILDHLSRGTIELKHLKTLVLDEADRMLDMGFIDGVDQIINNCPRQRQTLLFSATISEDIIRLSNKYMTNPAEINAKEYVDSEKLTQIYYDIKDELKYSLLKHLLEKEGAKLAMIFCNTRKNVDFVANNLKSHGINNLPIHGGFSQEKRNKIMEKFNSEKVPVLVCTDVAARGLDIKGVTHIYNFNIPSESKEYIHRIGRTARAGKQGKVINLIASRDYDNFSSVLKDDSLEIIPEKTPFVERVRISWTPNRNSRRDFQGNNNRYSQNRNSKNRGRSRDRNNRRYSGNRDSRGRVSRRYSSSRDSRSRDNQNFKKDIKH